MKIRAILFDVIGTTVREKNSDIVTDCLCQAFLHHQIVVDNAAVSQYRGKDKRQMILELLRLQSQPAALAEPIYKRFKQNMEDNLSNFSEMTGASTVFRLIKQSGIRLGIGTGLSKDLFFAIYTHLGWHSYEFDYIGVSEELGKSRPDPAMIHDMMQQLGIEPDAFLKVGDTIADIQEGKNAGVKTAVLLSGTQAQQDLLEQKPDYVLSSLPELEAIISSNA